MSNQTAKIGLLVLQILGASLATSFAGTELRLILAYPEFKRDDTVPDPDPTHPFITNLVINVRGKEPASIFWSVSSKDGKGQVTTYHEFPVNLSAHTQYMFTIEEGHASIFELMGKPNPEGEDITPFMRTRQALVRISEAGKVLFDREMCEVHHRKMQRIEAPIRYGSRMVDPKTTPMGKEGAAFPHFREYALGGCCSSDISPTTEMIFVCPDCKAAYEKWQKAHSSGTRL